MGDFYSFSGACIACNVMQQSSPDRWKEGASKERGRLFDPIKHKSMARSFLCWVPLCSQLPTLVDVVAEETNLDGFLLFSFSFCEDSSEKLEEGERKGLETEKKKKSREIKSV